jgi:hypothetical protein
VRRKEARNNMNLLDAQKFPSAGSVEYRLRTPQGVEVVIVWTATEEPRYVSYLERGNERIPLSMFYNDITSFCVDALQHRDGKVK